MAFPPSVSVVMPTLRIDEAAKTATLALHELRQVAKLVLATIVVDEEWYVAQYPDIQDATKERGRGYAAEHYRMHGYLEGRLPHEPVVDEEWYRKTYPDVDTAIREGVVPDAKAHFIGVGYKEGRKPAPDEGAAAPVPAAPTEPGVRQYTAARVPVGRAPVSQWSR